MTEKYIRAYNIYGSLIIKIPNEGYQKISQLNENLIVNDPMAKVMLTPNDVKKLNEAINPEKVKSENGIEMLKLVNQCAWIHQF